MYLVQNFETDFADFGQYMRIEANKTYEDDTNVKYLTISKWCQNWLKDRFEKDSKYAPNGIDLQQFSFKKRDFKFPRIFSMVCAIFCEKAIPCPAGKEIGIGCNKSLKFAT